MSTMSATKTYLPKSIRELDKDKWESIVKPHCIKQIELISQLSSGRVSQLTKFLNEIVHATVFNGYLGPEQVVECLGEAEITKKFPETAATLTDLLWFYALQTEGTEKRKPLTDLAKSCLSASILTKNILIERAESDFLLETGIFPSVEVYKRKIARVNTKIGFTQKKFNLLREESEGYAKLISELIQWDNKLDMQNVGIICDHVLSLIGYFGLDPNRVLDIVLDSYENNIHNDAFLKLVGLFRRDYLHQILGFKFQYFQNPDVTDPTPASLYLLAGKLVKNNLLNWEEIYPHLRPEDADATTEFNDRMKVASTPISNVISLGVAEKDKDEKKKDEMEVDEAKAKKKR